MMKLTEQEWLTRTTKINDELWCGRIECRQAEWLAKYEIDTVITIMTEAMFNEYAPQYPVEPAKNLAYFYDDCVMIPVADLQKIVDSFGKKTFVHCLSGCNRTTCVTIARLISQGMEPQSASNLYFEKRFATLRSYGPGDAIPRMTCEMRESLFHYSRFKFPNLPAPSVVT